MLWFRIAAVAFVVIVFAWSTGVAWGVIEMCSYGAQTKSMVEDPTKNGTITVYVLLTTIEVFTSLFAVFGLFIAFQMWRNNYQIDHSTRHLFIMWLGFWGMSGLLCLCVSVYMLVKGKDSQENMALLYDSFQKYSQDPKFVATLEKYQRENQCCGIYTPDDWLMLQLRQLPTAGGGGGGYQSLDYGFRQNPSTGKCHMIPPTIPPGCGLKLMEEIIFTLKVYAAVVLVEVLLLVVTAGLSSYCFFYWLDKEVIVIPEDEVSNVIIIEPESEATIVLSNSVSSARYFSRSRGRPVYLPSGRYGLSGSRYPRPGYSRSESQRVVHLSHTQILREQEEALGGRVLAEMHVEHKSTKMIPAIGSGAGQHHATVALVRNKHPPQRKTFGKKGHHGQTGNLAQDIVDMSGGSARDFIEDVVIPVEPPGVRPHAHQIPIGSVGTSRSISTSRVRAFSSTEIGGREAQNIIEDLIAPGGHKKSKQGSKRGRHQDHHRDYGGSHMHGSHHNIYGHPASNYVDHRARHHNSYLDPRAHHHHHGSYLEHGAHHHGSYLEHGAHHHGNYHGSRGGYLHNQRGYVNDHHHHAGGFIHEDHHHSNHEDQHNHYHHHHSRSGLHDYHHHHHHHHHRNNGYNERELSRRTTTVIFKNPRPIDEND